MTGMTSASLDGQSNNGRNDTFIVKYNPDGSKVWTKLLGGNGDEYSTALTNGIDGSIYVSGYTTASFDGQTHSNGNSDAFVTKYSSDGTKGWTKFLSGSGNANVKANGLSTGLDGSIYVTGSTTGSLDGQISTGGNDAFITKFDSDGTKSWTKQFGSSKNDYGYALATSPFGSIYVGGFSQGGSPIQSTVTKFPPPPFFADISTQVDAVRALSLIDFAIDTVNSTRSTIGSYINRLNYAADNATNISANLAASRSAIQDTDYAEESANLAKSQITQEAATAILTQANQQPQSVLALLKNM